MIWSFDKAKEIKHSQIGKLSALIIYFDDIIVPGDDSKEIERFKKQLTK